MTTTVDDISRLARALVDADARVDDAEQALKDAKERARVLREETIPSVMQELGLKDLTLDTGQKLKVQQEVYASIPASEKPRAYAWLTDNGFGGLLKTTLTIEFGRGERDKALEYVQVLHDEHGLSASFEEGVHAQTLKAFLKEQISAGRADLPLEIFGARPVWAAKISNK